MAIQYCNNVWTWMKGDSISNSVASYGPRGVEAASNNPGGNSAYTRWKDNNGNLWLMAVGRNTLWRYNPTTNNWAWMNGDSATSYTHSYGTKCIAAGTNAPPGRWEGRVAWTDVNGNFWTFGGSLYNLNHNDLWMYQVNTN